jgi:hypothetical protein
MTDLEIPPGIPWMQRTDELPFPVEWSGRILVEDAAKVGAAMRRNIQKIRAQSNHYELEHHEPAPGALERQASRALAVEDEISMGLSGLSTRTTGWYRIAVSGATEDEAIDRASLVRKLYAPQITIARPQDQYAVAREFIPGERLGSTAYRRRMPVTTVAEAREDILAFTAFPAVQGKAKGRAGAGFMALVGVTFTAVFRLIADIFVFAGLVMLRLLVMFFPAAAVFGVIAPMASIVRRIGNTAGASVVNVIAFGVGSAIHGVAIAAIITQANNVGMGILSLILCLVVSLAAFVLLMPLLSLTNILGHTSQRSMLRNVGRTTLGYFVGRKAVDDGTEDAAKKTGTTASEDEERQSRNGARDVGPARYVRRVNLPPESIGRRFDTLTQTQPDVPETQRHVGGRVIGRHHELPSSVPANGQRVPDTGATVAATAGVARRSWQEPGGGIATSALHEPRRPLPGRGIEGHLVDEVPSGVRVLTPIERTHDSHAEVTGEGLRMRMFDADTKSMVTVEPGDSERGRGHE